MAVHRGGGGPNFDKSEYCRLQINNKKYDYEYFNYVFAAVIIVLTRKVVISCKKTTTQAVVMVYSIFNVISASWKTAYL